MWSGWADTAGDGTGFASVSLSKRAPSSGPREEIAVTSANEIKLAGIDLNLLVVLEALLDERNVTRAAVRLNKSQPSVSSGLGRLRQLFNDPLLQREGNGMRPTPMARSLRPRVKEALDGVR